jgi:hypothetical protein
VNIYHFIDLFCYSTFARNPPFPIDLASSSAPDFTWTFVRSTDEKGSEDFYVRVS